MPARKNRRAGEMSQPERKIMKTRTTPSMLIAILLAFLALGATKAQAIVIINSRPVGITFGQTARVNILNTGDRAIIIIGGKFLDSDGNVIAEFRGTIDPGKTMSFDLNGDTVPRTENRIEIHVVIEGPIPHLTVISLEVFNNADGRTTVFLGGPDT
jgi:hypothetical protein